MQYELSYIINGNLEETKAKEVTQDLVGFISKIGQAPKVTIQLKTQALAYPIEKQTQGFWGALEFDIEAKRLPEVEKKLKDTKEIIRFMLTKKPVEKKVKKEKKREKIIVSPKMAPSAEQRLEQEGKQKPQPKKDKKGEKIEIKGLDKKLDEILKQI